MRPHRSWSALLAGAALLAAVAGCADDSNTLHATTTVQERGPGRSSEGSASADAGPTTPTSETHRPDRPRGRHGGETDRSSSTAADSSGQLDELAEEDVAGLLWMREEEQLAHDVYTALGEEWDLRIFAKISASERSHIDQVVGLLDRFGIDDPMAAQPSGTFTIPEMQELYDQLVAGGRASLVDALEVGALIEEIDIVDLRERASDVAAIQAVYTRLEQGSQRHLRAFVSRLDARDVAYQPTQLDPTAYDEIVADA